MSAHLAPAPARRVGTGAVIRVGTRGSPLALWQTRAAIAALAPHTPAPLEQTIIRTTGDAVQDRRLAEIGGKGLFAKEIHEAMLARRIDIAVHSLKDLETTLPDGIVLAATLPREDPRDAIILSAACTPFDPADPLACLPAGATIGTSSVRRQSQLLARRPDLTIALLRGNVATRLARTEAGDFAATLLAMAGLKRLDMAQNAHPLDPEAMVPAACQGIVGLTARADDTETLALLAHITDPEATVAATAERALLGVLDGSCRTPIGAHATRLPTHHLHLTALVARPDGTFLLKRTATGDAKGAAHLGATLGAELKADSPPDVFA